VTGTWRRLSWAAVAAPFVLLLCHQWFGPDIWYHLYLGERIARTFNPQPADRLVLQQPGYVNFYWLFQLIARGAYALGGIRPVSVLFIAAWAAALGTWLGTAQALRAGAIGPWLALAAVLVCQTRFEARPEVFSYVFLALQIHWLAAWKTEAPRPSWEIARFVLVQALWSNMHGYFALGPMLVALKLVCVAGGSGPDLRHRSGTARALAVLLALTILASAASPFGLRNLEEVAVLWHFFGAMHRQIQEFLPPGGSPQIALWPIRLFWAYWLCVLAAGIWAWRAAGRRELFALSLAATGLFLSAQAVRNIPLLVFFSGPLAGAVLSRIGPARRCERPARLALIATGFALSLWIYCGGFHRFIKSPGGFGIAESTLAYPVFFADYVRTSGFMGSVFNTGMDGGYLEFHCPALRPYGDSRFTDAALVDEYFRAVRRAGDFRQLQQRVSFDAVLLPIVDSRDVIVSLLRDPDWRLAYADSSRAFIASRRSAAGAAAETLEPRFYRGEDLSLPRYAAAAVEWTSVLAETGERDNLLRALREFAQAPKVPSDIVEIALNQGMGSGDDEIVAAARALRPKMLSPRLVDRETVDSLLRREPP